MSRTLCSLALLVQLRLCSSSAGSGSTGVGASSSTPSPISQTTAASSALDQTTLQYLWGVGQVADTLGAQRHEESPRDVSAVASKLLQLTKLSAVPIVADFYAKPGAGFDALDIVSSAGLSSGLSRDLVQFKARWEKLASRQGMARLAASRRSLVGRLLLHGHSALEHLQAGMWAQGGGGGGAGGGNNTGNSSKAVVGGTAGMTVVGAQAARNERAIAALAAAAARYLVDLAAATTAATDSRQAAGVLVRRLNVALGMALDEQDVEEAGGDTVLARIRRRAANAAAAAPTAAATPAPADPLPTGRRGHDHLKEVPVPNATQGGPNDTAASGPGQGMGTYSDLYTAVEAAEGLEGAVASLITTMLLPEQHVVAACALAGSLSGWAGAGEHVSVLRRLCGCGQGEVASPCGRAKVAVLAWIGMGQGEGQAAAPPVNASRAAAWAGEGQQAGEVTWDCCAPYQGPEKYDLPLPRRRTAVVYGTGAAQDYEDCVFDRDQQQGGQQGEAPPPPMVCGEQIVKPLDLLARPLATLKRYYQAEDQKAMAMERGK